MNENIYTSIEQQKDRYLHHCLCTKRLSDLTVSAYEIDLHQFLEFLESRYPDHTCGSTISKTILQEYILSMNARIMNRPLVVEELRINFDDTEGV